MLERRKPITIEEAQAKLAALDIPQQIETISLTAANHRILAVDALAAYDYPNFRRSGYDGYAIRDADDHDFPKEFHVVGEIQAGATFDHELGENETARIMTGAFVPDNAAKVIMLEQTRSVPDQPEQVKIMVSANRDNITPAGAEFKTGDLLIAAGTELNPGGLGLLTAFGATEVQVYRQPRVAIITTGTELLHPGDTPQPGKIFNSNGPLIANLVAENGAIVTETVQLVDDYQLLQANLERLKATNDLVITDGGVSVGDFDYLATTARDSDQLLFNKLKMRPGSVTTAFVDQGTLIIALSGNPGACYTGFYLFAEPILRRFVGQTSRCQKVNATLTRIYPKTNGYDKILRGTYQLIDGQYQVQLNGSDVSGDLGNLQSTTCLFKIPHSHDPLPLNAEVETWLLPYK
ncbi:molybdopterin molybdotransferase MoeA [Loigolactobacillus zhaoyuanensis]|uniref:molybdopterin molybdotransferase MoeA n=1 Tax=Loigolactobacillus zhaoyuanensis TaxID=2486017 RepID=UPI000F73782D|nr:molybdopterin molybdotransferase MoeA [Loigolactobacillus zhaoyuanensis]